MAFPLEVVMLACALASMSFAILLLVNSVQTSPYMDEIFHVPQAQRYCRYNFDEWDPMLTTLPGTYIISFLIARGSSWINSMAMGEVNTCSILWLRFHNLLYSVGSFLLIYKILERLHCPKIKKIKKYDRDPQIDSITTKCSMIAFTLSLFPLLYFFSFLYYTDQGSTFFVLSTYYLSLNDHHKSAALIGAMAVLFRQTNIVWVMFSAGTAIARVYDASFKVSAVQEKMATQDYRAIFNILTLITRRQLTRLLSISWPYILIAIAFIAFLIYNNGIVVGDRSHHQAALHTTQLLYFLLFTMFFSAPYFCYPEDVLAFLSDIMRYWYLTVCGVIGILISIYKLTYVHPYLLADNRHYTFYLWRRLYNAFPVVPYLLIPAHLYAIYVIYKRLTEKQSNLWFAVYSLAVVLAIVPQRLLEFRYFIIPYIMMRLHMPLTDYPLLLLEFFIYASIDYLTVINFAYAPFLWVKSSDVQRFMW